MKEKVEPDLQAILQLVEEMLTSLGFSPDEAKQRVALYKAQQHALYADALEAMLPAMSPEEKARELLAWALESRSIQDDLRPFLDPPPD